MNNGNKISRLIFGCEQLGGHNWGNYDVNDIINSINEALEKGLNTFDTSDVYGKGISEKLLGKVLNKRRKNAKIITKFGICFDKNGRRYENSHPDYISKAIIKSLKRLKTDYIDFYQLHSWDRSTKIDDIIYELEKLKEKGIILSYGQSNLPENDIIKYQSKFHYSSYEFSLIKLQKKPFLINKLKNHKILTYGGLGQGILSGKYDDKSIFSDNDRRSSNKYFNFHGKTLMNNLKIVFKLKNLSLKYNKTPSQLALKYIFQQSPYFSIIVGIKNIKQLNLNLDVLNDWEINEEDILTLENHNTSL